MTRTCARAGILAAFTVVQACQSVGGINRHTAFIKNATDATICLRSPDLERPVLLRRHVSAEKIEYQLIDQADTYFADYEDRTDRRKYLILYEQDGARFGIDEGAGRSEIRRGQINALFAYANCKQVITIGVNVPYAQTVHNALSGRSAGIMEQEILEAFGDAGVQPEVGFMIVPIRLTGPEVFFGNLD